MDEKNDSSPPQGKTEKPRGTSDGERETAGSRSGGNNVLGTDVEIKGSLFCRQELRIDGRVEGEINSEGVLIIGDGAEIRGDIKARSITIFGKVAGNITAAERCELKSRGSLRGDLQTPSALVEEGAVFVGNSFVQSLDAAQLLRRIADTTSLDRNTRKREPGR
jgi:cytoskeletal protein CcmA (bactofilin family)